MVMEIPLLYFLYCEMHIFVMIPKCLSLACFQNYRGFLVLQERSHENAYIHCKYIDLRSILTLHSQPCLRFVKSVKCGKCL